MLVLSCERYNLTIFCSLCPVDSYGIHMQMRVEIMSCIHIYIYIYQKTLVVAIPEKGGGCFMWMTRDPMDLNHHLVSHEAFELMSCSM